MNEIGKTLRKLMPERRWPVVRLPSLLAMVLAVFHPRLTVKQVRTSVGRHVNYDVGDVEKNLNIELKNIDDTFKDSIDSLDKLSRKV